MHNRFKQLPTFQYKIIFNSHNKNINSVNNKKSSFSFLKAVEHTRFNAFIYWDLSPLNLKL